MHKHNMDATNIYPIGRAFPNLPDEEPEQLRRKWWLRVTDRAGITIMANTEDKGPNGWSINPATVTLALVIAGLIAGGSYYMGVRDTNDKHLLERLEKAEKSASQAEKLSIAAAAGDKGPGHNEQPTPEPKKK